ncbi:hypothetical protein GMDG_01996 [Pseudogymnoascus destructans 20631-21]|uniref:Uncharacterized protein n=1 Tax=Pseudogymnoascus destructans (strain ATCC MYA-4855 / 20631-21) TaxID=658429 RepID=L8FZ68_PSED2|nr:hypothetical protein GMDG_01996 [Pseudogymnoascus destructans 20631-21]
MAVKLKLFSIEWDWMCVQNLYQRGFPEAAEDISMQTRDTDTTRWQEAVDYIYEMVKDAAAHKFSDIDDIERPTVIVFVAPGSLAHWAEVEAQIHQTIEAVPFEGDVEIALEILPSFNVPSTGPSTADTPTTSKHPRLLSSQQEIHAPIDMVMRHCRYRGKNRWDHHSSLVHTNVTFYLPFLSATIRSFLVRKRSETP